MNSSKSSHGSRPTDSPLFSAAPTSCSCPASPRRAGRSNSGASSWRLRPPVRSWPGTPAGRYPRSPARLRVLARRRRLRRAGAGRSSILSGIRSSSRGDASRASPSALRGPGVRWRKQQVSLYRQSDRWGRAGSASAFSEQAACVSARRVRTNRHDTCWAEAVRSAAAASRWCGAHDARWLDRCRRGGSRSVPLGRAVKNR